MKLHLPKMLLTAVLAAGVVQPVMGAAITLCPSQDFAISGGGQNYTTYNFENALAATETQELSFSFTVNIGASVWSGGD